MTLNSSVLGEEQKPPDGTKSEEETRPYCRLISPDEYSDSGEQTVPLRSLFEFLPLADNPIYVGTLPHKKPISEVLAEQVRDNAGATLQVNIEGRRFCCIPNLIKCYSVWFASRDWRDTSFTFSQSEVPAKGFECAYEWLRFQKLPSTTDAVDTLQVARYLQIDLLEPKCLSVLSSDGLREKAAFMVFRQAKAYSELPSWTLRDGFTHPDKDHLFSADPMLLAFNSDPKTETLLTDAMSYVATADSFMGDHNSYLEHMKVHRLPLTYPRKYVYHHKCPYHKYVLGVSDVAYNFKANDFVEYIESLQEQWEGDGPPSHGDVLVVDALQDAI
ncbi:LOW QUALITY PROTEIN: uncharacterized protein LOC117902504 [Drosophila subobscura]|uniref:LOW QUALITY PROTEIN: uncharacterized protein LOC117902504 n=1 Tax=Drosophila subobscura TaxID=7241 RepID=UPI00155A562A|nr:LOW QUALITY PROTEIN: uncharacterized protein LOC117902504 [Drosophila subobscura]